MESGKKYARRPSYSVRILRKDMSLSISKLGYRSFIGSKIKEKEVLSFKVHGQRLTMIVIVIVIVTVTVVVCGNLKFTKMTCCHLSRLTD